MSTSAAAPNTALKITRAFRAPRDHVYTAWTDPARMKWWDPEGCETIRFVADVRVGGKWEWALRTPMGEMSAHGTYRDLRPGEKLAYTWQWDDDPDWNGVESLITVEFRHHADGTELHLTHAGFPNEQSRDNHHDGWNAALAKLDRQLIGKT